MRRRLRAALLLAVAMVGSLITGASPAAADESVCGYDVRGAILDKYNDMGGQNSPLGCPTTPENATPDGRGAYTHFQGGSIYWSASTGAHPVWGAIRDSWAGQGWERGKLGYPVSDELRNPDGGARQQFQGGTYYWHATKSNGAHAVGGRIGELWAKWRHENGAFGYPTSDEFNATQVGGNLDENTGVRQRFENGRYLLWSPGQSSAFETCHSECVGYLGMTYQPWVVQTEVYINLANNKRSVHVTPSEAAFQDAKSDSAENWRQVWANTPFFPDATEAEANSAYKQMYCHAAYAFPKPGGGHFGGPTWDLETWRPDIPWDSGEALRTQCNW